MIECECGCEEVNVWATAWKVLLLTDIKDWILDIREQEIWLSYVHFEAEIPFGQ